MGFYGYQLGQSDQGSDGLDIVAILSNPAVEIEQNKPFGFGLSIANPVKRLLLGFFCRCRIDALFR